MEEKQVKKEETLIICASYHHMNTMHICKKIAKILNAKIIEPKDFKEELLSSYELIGFGSGIYNGKHHSSLLDLANSLNKQKNIKAFVFSTATIPVKSMHNAINQILINKGFEIIGQFSCKGFMTYGFTKYIFGGLNKGRPNEKDFANAINFATNIKSQM